MGKRKDLTDYDKGQIVMARRLGQSISNTAALVGCSRSVVVSTYQKWSKEGNPVNRRQGHGRPRLSDSRRERRLARKRALAVTSEQADKDSQQLTSESFGAAHASFTFCDNTAAASAPSEPDHHEDEDFISVALWRNCYLMDYDPLNQLLVCMVCGELQYSHSLEGVKAHIDQAHPQTMELEVLDRQRLLDAWDKQLSQRERFFTSQLQQKSAAVADADSN
ncbi:uncharacterized protein ACB058_002375 isoform 3-T6 [Synchiropus picturatus]